MLIKQQSSLQALIGLDVIKNTDWFKDLQSNDVKAIDQLKDDLDVSAQRDSDFVQVAMTCRSPKEAALIANTMIDLFVTKQSTDTSADIGDQLARLRDQESTISKDLKTIESALDDIRAAAASAGITMVSTGTGGDDQTRNTITLKLNELTIDRDKLQTQIKQIETNIGTLEELTKGPISVQTENQVETDPIMINLGERQSLLEAELAQKLARFGENHKEVRTIRESIRQTNDERNARKLAIGEIKRQANWRDAQDTLKYLTSQLAELERLRQEAEAKQKDLDNQRAKYESLTTMRDERQAMLTTVKQQIEKINMLRTDPDAPKVRKLGAVPEPLKVSSPIWYLYFSAGPFLGFLVGIALAFMIELLNDVVRTPIDITRILHSTLLGMIPNADEDDQADDVDLANIVRLAPYSLTTECYRRFRATLRLVVSHDSLKSILVTSGSPSEGKTSIAANLANTLAAEDRKVLFVDTNFRRPGSLSAFPAGQDQAAAGLSSLLSGNCDYAQAIRHSSVDNIDVIDCGQAPASPAELLGSPRMRQMIEDLGKKYDHIILDSAPALLVSDAKLLAAVAASTVVVINASSTKRGAALRTLRELQELNANVVGCVLLGVRALKGGYFHEMFESYRSYQKAQLAHSI
jgi:capsular exopolysaccharide synthesis family protein